MNVTPLNRRFAGELQLASNGDDAKSAKVKIVARTGVPISHSMWGKFVHDFSGMRVRNRIPLDYDHDEKESIGYLNKFDTATGDLVCSGAIVPFENDRGAEVIHKASEGVPYQASIQFGQDYLAEYIEEGELVRLNASPAQPEGVPVEGPCWVIREWELLAVAIVKFGADSDTVTQIGLSLKQAKPTGKTFIRVSGGLKMSAEVENVKDEAKVEEQVKVAEEVKVEAEAEAKVETETETKTEVKPLDTAVEAEADKAVEAEPAEANPEPQEEKPTALKAKAVEVDPRAEARKFIDTFGKQDGAEYFAEGLSLSDASAKHMLKLSKENKELRNRLASVDRGGTAMKFNDDERTGPKSFVDLIKPKK